MRGITITAALAVAAVLGLAGTASADIGDIDYLDVEGFETTGSEPVQGTAEVAQVEGRIRCTTSIPYGLIVKVTQPADEFFIFGEDNDDRDIEGVGAYGPNQGNEANSPCSTSLQPYEVAVQRNRDSGTYRDGFEIGVTVVAGTSAENGDRGPGPFIGDMETTLAELPYERTDP
jgi:hypothetical protein